VNHPLNELFGPGVLCSEAVPVLADAAIYPEEYAHVNAAVPKRRAEFATARILARRLLAQLGVPSMPLVPSADRAPRWPAGIVGTISHTDAYCAVAVARDDVVRAIGLDVETLRPIERDLSASIMNPHERAWVEAQPEAVRNDLVLLFFSAKEAYYKCQYGITRSFLEFLDVEVEVDQRTGRFLSRVSKLGWHPSVASLEGRFAFRSGKIFCAVELRTPSGNSGC
jgi:4'-phosphopantetheinyl transferase EntD